MNDSTAAPDPRTVTTDRKITAAVLGILTREGPNRLSIEAVAAESGVAKTSIYRRYANSDAMVDDVLARSQQNLAPKPLDLDRQAWTQDDWTRALDTALRVLIQDLGTGIAVTLLTEPNSETSRILRRHLVRPRMEQILELLQLQIDAGGMDPGTDLGVVVDFLLGSAYAHLAREGHLDETWAERVRDTLMRSVG
ncbi:TetR/AcrR family transcriptional regulator [Kocuria coralli]|uniref:TetR/AcrR family transcriptional regulator n=1 Tax=Kocuria coralli TaxID=1461025 RepID=A0A5J5L1B1_9MICC|nr:TetR/AcrR family transcriptional regulator [Kocuria coralli]KAA9394741.1 TetR/AcrR family transcriptional regulator [Kocuria coralli]